VTETFSAWYFNIEPNYVRLLFASFTDSPSEYQSIIITYNLSALLPVNLVNLRKKH